MKSAGNHASQCQCEKPEPHQLVDRLVAATRGTGSSRPCFLPPPRHSTLMKTEPIDINMKIPDKNHCFRKGFRFELVIVVLSVDRAGSGFQ